MSQYKNPWHKEGRPEYGPKIYETKVLASEYRGYLIYERIHGAVWDVVKDGACVTQMAGLSGAKRAIEELTI